MSEDWVDEYLAMINDCEQRESKLSEWEATFIDSIRHQITSGRTPTSKQIDKLNDIWERIT